MTLTMSKKILFFGTPQIAVPTLEALAKLEGYEILGVGVFPDRKVGRKQILTPCPVKIAAEKLALPIVEIADKKQLVEYVHKTDFDLGIVMAFGLLFPAEILEDRKMINIHFSLLPEYRGASPVQSAILDGKDQSGISWQIMKYELDAGDVLSQQPYLLNHQTTGEAWDGMAQSTAESLPLFLKHYFSNTLISKTQEESLATFCGKFKKHDGEVFPEKETATQIYRKFLAFTPWPGVYLETKVGRLKLLAVNNAPSDASVILPCSDQTSLFVNQAQLAGKKPTSMKSLLQWVSTNF